jgi:hypothetical protein
MMGNKKKARAGRGSSILVFLVITVIMFLFFSIGFIPTVAMLFLIVRLIDFSQLWQWMFLPFFLYVLVIATVVCEIMVSGILIKLFRIRYQPGKYPYTFWNKNAFAWMVICSLYTPPRKILEMITLGEIKNIYLRLLGMRIGWNTLVGGVVKDPCLTSIGNNTTIGEYAILYGHITNYQAGSINMKPIVIGNDCVIGAGAIIMPGAIIDDQVTVATAAVVTQDQHLYKGKTYVGIPAKELVSRKKAQIDTEEAKNR